MNIRINLTKMFSQFDPRDCSASVMELGEKAGEITYKHARDIAKKRSSWLVSEPPPLAALREWLGDFGAWDDEEIAKWPPRDCWAVFVQMIAGDLREHGVNKVDLSMVPTLQALIERGEGPPFNVVASDDVVYLDYYLG